jgi:hypothetical protein
VPTLGLFAAWTGVEKSLDTAGTSARATDRNTMYDLSDAAACSHIC